MAKKKKVLVVTPTGIAAYAWIQKADTGHQYSNGKFKVTLVLDGDTDLSDLEAKAIAAFKEEYPDAPTDELKFPWKSGEDHKNEEFHDKLLLFASSKFKPKTIDGKRKQLRRGVEVRSGDEVRLVVNLFPYQSTEKVREGKKTITVTSYGVSAQLNIVQLIRKNASGAAGLDLLDELDDAFDQDDYDSPLDDEDDIDTDTSDDDADY